MSLLPLAYAWWAWISAGILFGILEIVVPAYIFMGFSFGAIAMGILLALGVDGLSVGWMLVIFAAVSLVSVILLRLTFGLRRGQVKVWDRDIND